MGMGVSAAVTGFEAAQAVADAILYEGYLLYPYRRSSKKNRIRRQFGVLTPRAWTLARGPADTGLAGSAESWWQQTECLLEVPTEAADDISIHCRVRFLQLRGRTVEERLGDGSHRPADTLSAGPDAVPELSFDEAVPREFDVSFPLSELLDGERRIRLRTPGGEYTEPVTGGDGRMLGRVLRTRWPVTARLTMSATPCRTPFRRLLRIRARLENITEAVATTATRDEALRVSPIACHTLLAARGGAFVSLLDPPQWAEAAARGCSNVHTFPVLAGERGGRELVLSSPILLYDHPRVAPESPGDLPDATEIDEILSPRTLTLTDAEKREAQATDARAAAILDRVDTMPPEVLSRLHGTVRSRRTGDGEACRPAAPRWDPGADTSVSPETDAIVVDGTRVTKGVRVCLRPRRQGTAPQDAFLDGRTARVEAVLLDVDGAHHVAVTVEDDPGADLHRWYGRYRYLSPDEIEPLPDEGEPG